MQSAARGLRKRLGQATPSRTRPPEADAADACPEHEDDPLLKTKFLTVNNENAVLCFGTAVSEYAVNTWRPSNKNHWLAADGVWRDMSRCRRSGALVGVTG